MRISDKGNQLAETLGATPDGNGWAGTIDGRPYRFTIARSGATAFELRISAGPRTAGRFEISPLNVIARICTALGLSPRTRTGDADFDERFYVQSKPDEFASEPLRSPERRRAVEQLFEQGVFALSCDGEGTQAVGRRFDLSRISADEIRAIASHLVSITDGLPGGTSPEISSAWRSARIRHFYIGTFIWFALSFAAFKGQGAAIRSYPVIDPRAAFAMSLALTVPLVALAAFIARKRLRPGSDVVQRLFVVILFWAAPIVFGSWALTLLLNAGLDHSSPSQQDLQVMGIGKGRANVVSWISRHDTEVIPISSSEYRMLARGKKGRMSLATKAGWLGLEWISAHHVYVPGAPLSSSPR